MNSDNPRDHSGERPPNPILVEIHRGNGLESIHLGAMAIADSSGDIIASWATSWGRSFRVPQSR